jgi:alkylhydroperoxidase/carboxymuconolactone decarboxylase family protein YurZ
MEQGGKRARQRRTSEGVPAVESGVPFHVQLAKRVGASRAEIVSAILIGLPAAGNAVTQCLPAALSAFDAP